MSIYDITYKDRIVELLPPDKRFINMVRWMQALVQQFQYLHTDVLKDYRTGSVYPNWTAGTYAHLAKVVYGQSVYESLINGNTAIPTNSAYWRLYENTFIGVETRVKFNAQDLVLTYALNLRFGTTFRQPPSVSDIYISTQFVGVANFRSSDLENFSSNVSNFTSSEYIKNTDDITTYHNFIIYVPVAVYNALDPLMVNNENIIRSFVNQYIPVGLTYLIQTY